MISLEIGRRLGVLARLLGSPDRSNRLPLIGPAFGQLLYGLVALLLVVTMGIVGYIIIADLSAFDALYQTVITVTTIGFEEVEPLDDSARAFTIALAVVGVTVGLYLLTGVGRIVVEGELVSDVGAWHMNRNIRALQDHTIVCGAGRVGWEIAVELERRGKPFVVIDPDPAKAERIKAGGWLVIEGDASDNDVLQTAGVARARALVAATASDAENTFITLTAKGVRPDLYIVARANDADSEPKQRQAGADRVVSPMQIAGRRLALAALHPAVGELAESLFGDGAQMLAEIAVRVGSPLDGSPIGETIDRDRGVVVLGLRRAGGELLVGPSPRTDLAAGDTLIVMGDAGAIDALPTEPVSS